MPENTRTTVYFTQADRDRLERFREKYGMGASVAMRVGLALLEERLETSPPAPAEPEVRKALELIAWSLFGGHEPPADCTR